MKNYKILVLLISILASSATLANIKKPAVVRDKNFKAKIEEVELPELIDDKSYETSSFKIVKGKSEQAITFSDSEELQLKAATALYHLTKAKAYFIEVVKSPVVTNLPQITIRLDLTNVFNEIGHFAHDNLTPQFNNALAVPAGVGYPARNVGPWGAEIWFRPSKEINIKDYPELAGNPGLKNALTSFRNQSHMGNLDKFIARMFAGSMTDPKDIMRLVGSSLLIEVVYQTSDIAAEFFAQKIYRLDAALVPEIIYHEFAHIALSEVLELSHSTPVNEGLADFFAGKIANSKKLATKIKQYNLYNGKEVRKKQQYQLAFERGEFANTDFVFGLLWNVGSTVGSEIEPEFIHGMAEKLTTNSNIKDDLVNATLETCSERCTNPFTDKIKLFKLYDKKNL